ncbi:hypothetical protein [Paenibacillus kobensis]|uniref:hypothetical protein n=1 Tax=Paenibacillus kobensis TaxID=59841 RepID=UPI000FDB6865|nr:hypothetical protein [Paenibacillus kobensis]
MNTDALHIMSSRKSTYPRSYVDAMHTILTKAGWMDCTRPMLSGMTVNGFRFSVNRRLSEESPTAYNWHAEHFLAADFIGVTCSSSMGFNFVPTFPLYRKQAILDIKASIDRGIGAIIWHEGFVVAETYDDQDGEGALLYSDGFSEQLQRLSYAAFGGGPSPYWYYQVMESRISMDDAAVIKESFLQAIFKWETHDLTLPEQDYACGRAAYEAIINALESGDYDREGAKVTFDYYEEAKRDISVYMREAELPHLATGAAAACYEQVAELFSHIIGTDIEDSERLCQLFREALQAEEQAIKQLRLLVREEADNRFHDIGLR